MNWNLDDETENDLMTDGRDLPWLQDTTGMNVKAAWGAVYRDVVILDAWNRPLDPPFNLTSNDLGVEANREALKERLRQAAVMVDTDGDKIGDDWEERHLSGLDNGVEDDPDQDGEVNFLEYALGSLPAVNGSRPIVSTRLAMIGSEERLTVTFRRRLGSAGGLKYVLEWSETGEDWVDAASDFEPGEIRNPYDGSGTEMVTLTSSNTDKKAGLFRVRATFE